MADAVYGFGAGDVKRIRKAVHRAERDPVNRPQPRGRYPVMGGGDKLIPVQVTERVGEAPDPPVHPDDDDREPIAVHRVAPWILDETDEDAGFEVMRLTLVRGSLAVEENAERETAFADVMHGVYCTGDRCFAVKKYGKLFVVGGGVDAWHAATAQEDISDSGPVLLYEDGPEVDARVICGATVTQDSSLVVAFDDQAQEFVITVACCPT